MWWWCTWALAPIDESLTAKYITALGVADAPERTAKDALPDRAGRVLDDAMARGVWRDPLQRPGEFDAALPSLGGWPEASPPVRACIADLERDIVTRSEVGLLFDDDCFRIELGWRRDNTRVRPTGPAEGVYIRLNLATFGSSGYDRNDMR